jgi:hypothetical protein
MNHTPTDRQIQHEREAIKRLRRAYKRPNALTDDRYQAQINTHRHTIELLKRERIEQ